MRNKNNIFPLTSGKLPAVAKGQDWRTYEGEVKTSLIGVPIPRGRIVFDLDTYKGVTREDVERLFNCTFAWDDAVLQKTPRGGEHYAFDVPVDIELTNGVNVLGLSGFDTRSAGKGYIATGSGYIDMSLSGVAETLHCDGYFPELPESALELLRDGSVFEGSDLLSLVSSQPLDLSEEEIVAYMGKLTPEQAEDGGMWLKVMFAVYHQTSGSAFGWELFDTFSRLCPEKYDQKKNRSRWESCARSKKANPVTFASVIELVGGSSAVSEDKYEILMSRVESCDNKADLRELLKDVSAFKTDGLNSAVLNKALSKKVKEITGTNITEAGLKKVLKAAVAKKKADYYEDYIFVTVTGEYMHRETKTRMGPRAFDVQYNRLTPPDSEGCPQTATSYSNNRIECVHDGMYAPQFSDVFDYEGVAYFNTYRPSRLQRVMNGQTDIVDRVIGHIAHLLPDYDEQQLVINYLAHNVQYPGKKMFWAVILQGVQGDGKSFFAEMMKHVLGPSNCRSISAESLDEKYTPWAEGNVMVFLEELKVDNHRKYETNNKLKPYISNTTVSVRRMRTDIYECINTSNYFALTNYKDALPIDDSDRRFCVLFSRWQSKEKLAEWMRNNPDYYQDLYDLMRSNAGELLDWLLSHKIPDSFLKLNRAPDTRAKQQMINMSKGDDVMVVEDALNEFKCEDINEYVINITKLQQCIDNSFESDYSRFPKTSRLKNILLDMGYHNIGRYKTLGDSRKNQLIYCKDDTKNASDFRDLDPSDFVPF